MGDSNNHHSSSIPISLPMAMLRDLLLPNTSGMKSKLYGMSLWELLLLKVSNTASFLRSQLLLPQITATEIYENVNPRNNYFRIEEFAHGNISFVDGLGCNTGYFKLDNLYKGSTTAAHEYGHTLGLHHPTDLDIRGKGKPGIMYPRGTLVDAPYQYNPAADAGDSTNGGTMHPMHRRVRQEDIDLLKLHKLDFDNGKAIIGEFTSVWHPNHADISSNDYLLPITSLS